MRIALLTAFLILPAAAFAQKDGAQARSGKPAAKSTPLTPEREKSAIEFAKANHPELAELLGNLKTMDETQYKGAVSTLASQADALAALAKRDSEMHAV